MTSGYKYPAGASRAGWLPALNRRQRAESRSPLHPAKTTEEDHDACELSRNGIDSGWVCEDDDAESDDANSEDGNSIGWYVLVEEEWDGEDPPEVESPVAVGIGATEGTIALADAEESTESINSTAKAEKGQATPFSVVGRQAVSASTTDATRQAPTSVISYETERESVSEARSKALGGNDGIQRYHPGARTPDMNPSPPPSANGD